MGYVIERFNHEQMVIDGVNAIAQSRNDAVLLYKLSRDSPILAIGEGTLENTPLLYYVDNIVKVQHRIHKWGVERWLIVEKARGMPLEHHVMRFIITSKGPLFLNPAAPSKEFLPISLEKLKGYRQVVETLEKTGVGGIKKGSRVLVKFDVDKTQFLCFASALFPGRKIVITRYPWLFKECCECDILDLSLEYLGDKQLSDLAEAVVDYDYVIVHLNNKPYKITKYILDVIFAVNPNSVAIILTEQLPKYYGVFDYVISVGDKLNILKAPVGQLIGEYGI